MAIAVITKGDYSHSTFCCGNLFINVSRLLVEIGTNAALLIPVLQMEALGALWSPLYRKDTALDRFVVVG
jgi:hypothetical protein